MCASYAAVVLFVQRAQATDDGFVFNTSRAVELSTTSLTLTKPRFSFNIPNNKNMTE